MNEIYFLGSPALWAGSFTMKGLSGEGMGDYKVRYKNAKFSNEKV
jgi:hypothetical protein